MEIREKVVSFVKQRIQILQKEAQLNVDDNNNNAKEIDNKRHEFNNISVIHTNVMKYICNYFEKQSVEAIFFCFPDPHFKKSNKRRRIISVQLLDYYAFILKDFGLIYNITDVKELYEWTIDQFSKHPLFKQLNENEYDSKVVDLIMNKTDEAQRVARNKGEKFICIFQRIPNAIALQ